jgi:hypothetical protein
MTNPSERNHPQPTVDPALRDQLVSSESSAAASSARPKIAAVFSLKPATSRRAASRKKNGARASSTEDVVPSPDQVDQTVRKIIEHAEAETGKRVDDLNVFRYLNSFVVAADPEVIESILREPEIASAVANRQPGDADLLAE